MINISSKTKEKKGPAEKNFGVFFLMYKIASVKERKIVKMFSKSKRNTGAQPEILQGRGGFMELDHFDKHFVKNKRKKRPRREKLWSIFSHVYSQNYILN